MKKTMSSQKVFSVFGAMLLAAASARMVAAAPLDLNGTDRTVTDVAEISAYDGVTNSAATLATLTFNNSGSVVQEYAGVISGNIKLVKDGGKFKLRLSGANTYTGGTLIKKGILVAGSATACGDVAKSVEIESRVQVASTSLPENGPWCTLQIDVSGFANPIILPTGTDAPRWVGNTFIEHSLCVTNGGLSINSPISGGRFTFMAVKEYATNKAVIAAGNVTFNGPITCTGISIYSTGNLDFRGAVTNSIGNISGGTWRLYPTYRFYSSENQFNGTSFTGTYRYVYAMADNVFNGLDSFAFGADERVKLYLNGHDVTIGRVSCTSVSGNNTQMVDGGSGATSVLRMRAGENTISSAFFNRDLSLVWDPTGDYTFTATSNRTSTLKGPLVVKGGTFELDGGHTMLNVTNIIVKSGATLKVSSGTPFASSVTIEAESGATLDIAEDVTATTVKVGDHYLSAKDFSAGTYKGLTITGAGKLYVTSKPGGEDTYTWTGGGADDNITTVANWQNSAAPDFDDEAPFIVFAGGAAAVLDRDVSASGITFDGVTAFNLSTSGNHVLSLGAGGISNAPAASARAVTVSAPVMPLVDQVWQMETNTTFTLSGVLKKYGTSAPTITVRQSSTADPTITFVGSPTPEGASDFAGDIVFARNDISADPVRFGTAYVRASGYEPFGPTGTLTLESTSYPISATNSINQDAGIESAERGRYPCLFLTNAVVSKSVSIPSTYGAVIAADASSTNELKGALTLSGADSHPHFKVGPDSLLAVDASYSKTKGAGVAFRQFYCKASDNSGSGRVVFRGKLTLGSLNVKQPMTIELNAVSNSIDQIADVRSGATAYGKPITIVCGGENAFHDGSCEVSFSNVESGSRYANFDLNGHDQYIGRPTACSAGAAFVSSDGEAVLRVNYTANGSFRGTVATNVVFQKEGDYTLTFTHATAFKAGSTLAVSNGTVAVSNATALNENVTLKLMGGAISIPEGKTALVGEAYYLDGNGELKPLMRGLYGPGDAKIGSFFAPGSGSIRVKKGPAPGFIITYK